MAQQPKFVPRDNEDKEILAEMEKEGIKIGEAEDENAEKKPEEENQPALKPADSDKKDDEEDDEEDEEDEDDEEDDGVESPEGDEKLPEKKPKFVESWKVGKMKRDHEKTIAYLNKKITELSKKPDDIKTETDDKNAAIKATAEELGIEEGALKKIIALVGPGATTKELSDKIAALETQLLSTKDKVDWEDEHRQFGKDFDKSVMPILAEQGITEEKTIGRIKKLLEKMAFSDSFQGVPTIEGIYRGYPSYFADITKKGKPGVEAGSKGGNKNIKGKDLKDMEPGEAAEKLSDEEFERYCALRDDKRRFVPQSRKYLKGTS